MFPLGMGVLALGYALAYHGVNVLLWAHGSGDPTKQDPVPLKYLLGFPVPQGKAAPKFLPLINMEGAKAPNGAAALGGGPNTAPATSGTSNTTPPTGGGGSLNV